MPLNNPTTIGTFFMGLSKWVKDHCLRVRTRNKLVLLKIIVSPKIYYPTLHFMNVIINSHFVYSSTKKLVTILKKKVPKYRYPENNDIKG